MNKFQKIYKIVSRIPKGKVLTYGMVAKLSQTTPRVVGFALHANKNPDKIPCHRVVKKDGIFAKGYAFGGQDEQRSKLRKEGIIISKNKIELQNFLFNSAKPSVSS